MAFFALWCFLIAAAAFPAICPRFLGLATYPPDPWLLLIVYLAMRGRGFTAVGWAIFLGLLRDAQSLEPLGTHAFVLGATAFIFCEGRRHRSPVEGPMRLLAVFGATVSAGVLYAVRMLPMDGAGWTDVTSAVPVALWTTLLAAGLYPIFDQLRLYDDLMGRHRGVPA